MYTVGRAAELTGIPRDTLRKWESRYGVVRPTRTESGYRLYDDEALRRLVTMRELVDAGWAPRQAARQVLANGGTPRPDAEASERRADVTGLVRAAEDMDPTLLERTLTLGLAGDDLAAVVDGWLIPSLVRLGLAWSEGRVSVAGEHFASAAVLRRLAGLFDDHGPPAGAPHVVVGLARGARHELGVLAFATLLRRNGLRTTYVGGDLPVEDWLSTVRDTAPAAVVLGVPMAEDVPAVREVTSALARRDPDLFLGLGGAHQDRVPDGAPLGHVLGDAAARLADRLRG